MKLYEINSLYEDLMDQAWQEVEEGDGGIPEWLSDRIDAVSELREDKIHNIGLLIKNKRAAAEAIEDEAKRLAKRAKAEQNAADYLENWLSMFLKPSEKYACENLAIGWRKSTFVATFREPTREDRAIRYKEEIAWDKAEIARMLKAGEVLDYAKLVEKQNLQVK